MHKDSPIMPLFDQKAGGLASFDSQSNPDFDTAPNWIELISRRVELMGRVVKEYIYSGFG